MGAAKNSLRLLEPPFRLFRVKGEQFDRNVRARHPDRGGCHGGSSSVHWSAKICCRKLGSKIVYQGGGRRRRKGGGSGHAEQVGVRKVPVAKHSGWSSNRVTNLASEHYYS